MSSMMNLIVLAFEQEASHSLSVPQMSENKFKDAFFGMLSQWFTEFMRANHMTLEPLPPVVPSLAPPMSSKY